MMKRELSQAAQVAKLCRQNLKGRGIQCRTRSSNFSMGNSVDVNIKNQRPEVVKEIEAEFSKYQSGHFDGMTDMYEYSNSRSDMPQTKYLFIHNEISDEIRQKAWDYLRAKYPANGDSLPADYSEASRLQWSCDSWNFDDLVEQEVRKILLGTGFGYMEENSKEFWDSLQPEPITYSSNASGHIEEHEHTKKGFAMYMVVLDSRVDREDFTSLRESAQSMGGWYSRQWGSTPGGFAFKELELAEQFLASLSGDNPQPAKGNGDKFRTMADKLEKQISDKFAERLTNTPKRLAQANSARAEGERLLRTQKALYALADLYDSGEVPQVLRGITSKSAVYDLMRGKLERVPNGYHDYVMDTGKPALDMPEALALWSLLDGKSEEEKKEEELRRKIDGLQFSKIPGFFPTPQAVVDQMLEYVDIKPHDNILEPNIGSCAIADRICERFQFDNGVNVKNYISSCEINSTLADIAEAKGYHVNREDFLSMRLDGMDWVLMNPPFENLQDVDHVQHAYKMLKEGGRLVSIMSPGPFFRSDKKSQAFREWFESLGGEKIDIPAGAFKESGTNVSSCLVVLDA